MCVFSKFESIKNLENHQKKIPEYRDLEVIVCEKVHGANFSIIGTLDTEEIVLGKRTCTLEPGDPFSYHEAIKGKLLEMGKRLRTHLQAIGLMSESFHLYGELCGGGLYPGLDKEIHRPVQTGIWYSPNIEFLAFDLKIDKEYQSDRLLREICNKIGIKCVPIIGRFSFSDAVSIDVDKLVSQVPTYLGYDYLENNYAEGIIIKTDDPVYIRGNRNSRFIFKKKASKFQEKCSLVNKEENGTIMSILKSYIVRNRLDAVISKFGYDGTEKMMCMIAKCLVRDVFEAYKDEGHKLPDGKNHQKLIRQNLNSECIKFVKENLII